MKIEGINKKLIGIACEFYGMEILLDRGYFHDKKDKELFKGYAEYGNKGNFYVWWNTKDLTGMLLEHQKEAKSDQWELVEFPAVMPSGNPVWPEYWNAKELETVKASLSAGKWNAQWMQNPTSEEGAIIKREWWKKWTADKMPVFRVEAVSLLALMARATLAH